MFSVALSDFYFEVLGGLCFRRVIAKVPCLRKGFIACSSESKDKRLRSLAPPFIPSQINNQLNPSMFVVVVVGTDD